jgi:rSAM/selenodomain-associated transferase 1
MPDVPAPHEDVAGEPAPVAAALAIFARAPVPGAAKTRLVPRLGAEGAAALHARLVEHTLRTAASAAFADLSLWCTPSTEHPVFRACERLAPLRLVPQPAGDLGARMHAVFEALLPAGRPIVLVGTDAPGLTAACLREAASSLAGGDDAVVVPAEDGGYALLGLRRVDRALFDGVPWGTDAVLAETRTRLSRLRWTWRELAPVRDVDRPEDVDWLLESGLLDAGAGAPATSSSPAAPSR